MEESVCDDLNTVISVVKMKDATVYVLYPYNCSSKSNQMPYIQRCWDCQHILTRDILTHLWVSKQAVAILDVA